MFKVVGKLLIFVLSVALFILSISQLIIFCTSYIQVFNNEELLSSSLQFIITFICGIIGISLIKRNKKTLFLLPFILCILAIGVYFAIYISKGNISNYFYCISILDITISAILLVSLFWNRKGV